MVRTRVGLVLLSFLLSAAGEARAQLDLTILDKGKTVTDIPVRGDTGLNPGDQVDVWVKRCQSGQVEVVLVPDGSNDPCVAEGAQAGEGCGCEKIGTIVVGDGPVAVDVGDGTVTQPAAPTGAGPPGVQSALNLGVGFDLRQMLNLEDVSGMASGATSSSATGWSPGIQLFAEWLFWRLLTLGIDASYATMDSEVTFPQGVQTADISYYEVGVNAKIGLPVDGPIRPYVTGGLFRTWNKADFSLDGVSEHRTHIARRDGLGAGVDWYPNPYWGFRFEGLYSSTFEDNDADEQIRWKIALMYRPWLVMN